MPRRGLLLRRDASDPVLGDTAHWSQGAPRRRFSFEMSGWTPLADLIYSERALRSLLQAPEELELVSYSDPKKAVFRYVRLGRAPIGGLRVLCRTFPLNRQHRSARPSTSLAFAAGGPPTRRCAKRLYRLLVFGRRGCYCGAIRTGKWRSLDRRRPPCRTNFAGSCVPELKSCWLWDPALQGGVT